MCSIEEAFETSMPEMLTATSSRNDTIPGSSKSERSKTKKQKRQALLPPPEPKVIEPDRPAHQPKPDAEILSGSPVENIDSSSPSLMLNAFAAPGEDHFPYPTFEHDDKNMFMLEPNWASQFINNDSQTKAISRNIPNISADGGTSYPSPLLDGAPTLWQQIPPTGWTGKQRVPEAGHTFPAFGGPGSEQLKTKIDQLFERLQALEIAREESSHIEMILFVLGGVFLLFMLDLIVKQGMKTTILMAAAGGSYVARRNLEMLTRA